MSVLLVEDDPLLGEGVRHALSREGHSVTWAKDGEEALAAAATQTYSCILLDLRMPQLSGLAVLKRLRAQGNRTPVIIVTASEQPGQKIEGLDAGADDYLVKPFAFAELLARVSALARRPPIAETTALRVGDLEVDLLARTVTRAGKRLDLHAQEFKILEYLMRHAGEVVTRSMLLERVWDFHFDPKTNIVETHISRLRSRIDKGFDKPLLHTIRGAGYVIRPD